LARAILVLPQKDSLPRKYGNPMSKLLLGISAACAVLFFSIASSSEPSLAEAQKQLLRVDREWADAELRRDANALRRILDDSFIAVYGSGKVVDKEAFIKNVIGDASDKILSQDISDITVRVQGDAAVLVETDTIRGTDDGQPYVTALRLTITYIKRNGRWVALAEHFARATDLKADEAAIRKADADWVEAARSKQVDAWLAFYTDNAVVLPPNDKVANGKQNARKSVGDLLALPGLSITWRPTKVVVARSGDIAYLTGAYSIAFKDPSGASLTDQGKLLEVWEKQADGKWLCSADTWNSDLPASPPPK
jgi:ketosteroid isomerase-like protein